MIHGQVETRLLEPAGSGGISPRYGLRRRWPFLVRNYPAVEVHPIPVWPVTGAIQTSGTRGCARPGRRQERVVLNESEGRV